MKKDYTKREMLNAHETSLFLIFGYVAFMIINIILASMIKGTGLNVEKITTISHFAITLFTQLGLLVPPLFFALKTQKSIVWSEEHKEGLNIKQLAIIIALVVFSLLAFAPINMLIAKILEKMNWKNQSSVSPPVNKNALDIFLSYISIALLPGFCEETFFRSTIGRGYKKNGYICTIFLTSAIFSLFHGSIEQTFYQFFLSLVITSVYLITSSFWAAFLLHFLNNAVVVTISLVSGSMKATSTSTLPEAAKISIIVVEAVLSLLTICLLLFLLFNATYKKRGIFKEDLKNKYEKFGKVAKMNKLEYYFWCLDIDNFYLLKNMNNMVPAEEVVGSMKKEKMTVGSKIFIIDFFVLVMIPWIANFVAGFSNK